MGLGAIAAAALGAAATVYSSSEQSKAQKKASNMQQAQALEARRIAAEQKPMEEIATLQTDTQSNVLGNLGLAIEADYSKKKVTNLGGTNVSSGLGFGSKV